MSTPRSPTPHDAFADEKWHTILEVDLRPPMRHVVDISSHARPGRFRLIDCAALVDHRKLVILQSGEDIDDKRTGVPYAVISYIWRGRPVGTTWNCANSMQINGAEDGDPISVDVLQTICEASLTGVPGSVRYHPLNPLKWVNVPRTEYLWVDQLCISQKDDADKTKQIANMYGVYKNCRACFIIPGGIQRLVPLNEGTSWTHRAWTLQECLVPERTFVIFSWSSASRMAWLAEKNQNWMMSVLPINSETALSDFKGMLRACTFGPLRIGFSPTPGLAHHSDCVWTPRRITVGIFGKYDADLYALFQILEDKSAYVDRKTRHGLVWRCALTRTSSRPVDMVFSIMGLLGVRLSPREFHQDDRLGATIALITAILENGGHADWLGIVPSVMPSPELSTFPIFPETSVTGEVTVHSSPFRSQANHWIFENAALDDPACPDPFDRITGYVDDVGYVFFRRRVCTVMQPHLGESEDSHILIAEDGKARALREDLNLRHQPFPRTAIIPLWSFRAVNHGGSVDMDMLKVSDTRQVYMFMIIKEHGRGKFHVVTYWMHDPKNSNWDRTVVNDWQEYDLAVGGPRPRMVNYMTRDGNMEIRVPDGMQCPPH